MTAVDNFLRACRESVSNIVATAPRALLILAIGISLFLVGVFTNAPGATSALSIGTVLTMMGAVRLLNS